MSDVLIEVRDLRRVYRMGANELVALDGLNLGIHAATPTFEPSPKDRVNVRG